MPLSENINDLEKAKFVELSGETAVRTTGTATFSGLSVGGSVTVVALNATTWTALPASALDNRNALAVQNDSGVEVKVNYDNATVGYVGMTIRDKEERFYDITDSIVLYAKAASGTPSVNVEELA